MKLRAAATHQKCCLPGIQCRIGNLQNAGIHGTHRGKPPGIHKRSIPEGAAALSHHQHHAIIRRFHRRIIEVHHTIANGKGSISARSRNFDIGIIDLHPAALDSIGG